MKNPLYLPPKYQCKIDWRRPSEVIPFGLALLGLGVVLFGILTYGGS
jgi:hypothetical protein